MRDKQKIILYLFVIVILTTTASASNLNKINEYDRSDWSDSLQVTIPKIHSLYKKLSQVIDQEQDQGNSFTLIMKAGRQYAQSFKPSLSPICKVELRLYVNKALGLLHFAIREELDGNNIIHQSGIVEGTSNGWISFDFDDFEVAIDETYYLVIWADTIQEYGWYYADYNPYPQGEQWTQSMNLDEWLINEENDFCFKTYAEIENDPPEKPDRPEGAHEGKPGSLYTYTSSAIDPDSDEIYYLWDWGDGTESGWLGPYTNGDICEQEHAWLKKGNYNVRVKAKDTWNMESDWSDPLVVTMPKTHNLDLIRLIHNNPLLITPLEQLFSHNKRTRETTDGTEYWGLLIAVGEYLNHPDQDRPSMLVEVEHMYQSLIASDHWDPSHIRKITGQNANLDNILDGFLWLLQMADNDDISLVYITTHGGYLNEDYPPKDEADGKDEILVPYEGFDDPTKFLWDDEINVLLTILRSQGICLIVDSCYSGGFNDAVPLTIQSIHEQDETELHKKWIEDIIQELGASTGRVILMSSEEDEVSYGSKFSRYIADGLEGDADDNHDDICTAEEAFKFAEEYYGSGANQHPTIKDTYGGELPLTGSI